MLPHSTRTEEARPGHGEDRIAEIRMPGRTLFVVADGAGGAAGGADAAEAICGAASAYEDWRMPSDWAGWLAHVDREMSRSRVGLAAAVVIEIWDDGRIIGASVGDCEAWMFGGGAASRSLTAGQSRKPLMGEGTAQPVGFQARLGRGTLLMATDGLWKCMKRARIAKATAIRPLEAACATLVDGARLRNGTLQDDVALVLAELA
ncbi:MAG: SpoIIE family protein phosphatase [Polyangia bacterium]